jgi:soluble lytic murein transglycosylase-like protein
VITTIVLTTMLAAHVKDPYRLHSPTKKPHFHMILEKSVEHDVDAMEALAIAITESALKPRAYSHTQDVGLFQVNCKWWWKKFKYSSRRQCEKSLLDPARNIDAGLYILKYFRSSFPQCKGDLAYRCYNGGQRWPRSKNKHKIIKYSKAVQKRKAAIVRHYLNYIYAYQRRFIQNELLH